MDPYWTSKKTINGLKHFVVINQYKFKNEVYLEFVSVLDTSICFKISKKAFEASSQWIKGWHDNEKENIDLNEYRKFKSKNGKDNPSKIILKKNSRFNIS